MTKRILKSVNCKECKGKNNCYIGDIIACIHCGRFQKTN